MTSQPRYPKAIAPNPRWFTSGPVAPLEVASISGRVNLGTLNDKRILITGAQGFIGNYLAQSLVLTMIAQGFSPSRLFLQSRRDLDDCQNWTSSFRFIELLNFPLDFAETFPPADVIIHAASPASPSKFNSPESSYTPNISGVVSSLALSPIPERVLFISSGEVYGLHDRTLHSYEVDPNFKLSGIRAHYPNAKLAAEKLLLGSSHPNSKFNVARLFHTFGPGLKEKDGRSFADFLYSAAQQSEIHLYSEGEGVRNFAYIEDSISGLLQILVSDSSGQVFDVAGETRISIKDFAKIVAKERGVRIVSSNIATQNGRTPVVGHSPIPSTQSLMALGWSPRISLEEGVRRTLEFIEAS